MTAIIAALRDGRFLTRERLVVYPLLLLGGYALGAAILLITAHEYDSRPLGITVQGAERHHIFARNGVSFQVNVTSCTVRTVYRQASERTRPIKENLPHTVIADHIARKIM